MEQWPAYRAGFALDITLDCTSMQLSNEFLNGFYSGVLATTIGFVLTMIWDLWKTWRTERKRDRDVVRAILSECEENVTIAQTNTTMLRLELKLLSGQTFLISTAVPFKTGLWETLRPNMPRKLLSNIELLSLLRDISSQLGFLNEGFRSRQTYKDASGAMSNFFDRVKGMDEHLQEHIEKLNDMLTRASVQLRAFGDAI